MTFICEWLLKRKDIVESKLLISVNYLFNVINKQEKGGLE